MQIDLAVCVLILLCPVGHVLSCRVNQPLSPKEYEDVPHHPLNPAPEDHPVREDLSLCDGSSDAGDVHYVYSEGRLVC